MSGLRSMRPSPALLVALLALVVAMSGTAYAAVQLQKDSVLSKHIKNGQVKRADLAAGSVTGAKVKDGSLMATDFGAGQLPAGPQGPAGPVDTVTVVKGSGTIDPGSFGTVTVECPAGMEAIGGGVDLANVLTMAVTSSAPVIENQRVLLTPEGQHPAATGWRGSARNDSASTYSFKVAVVCAG